MPPESGRAAAAHLLLFVICGVHKRIHVLSTFPFPLVPTMWKSIHKHFKPNETSFPQEIVRGSEGRRVLTDSCNGWGIENLSLTLGVPHIYILHAFRPIGYRCTILLFGNEDRQSAR